MYQKAIQTTTNWAFAYEASKGGYAMKLSYIGSIPILDDEPEFAELNELESHMKLLAPLDQWSEALFKHLLNQANDVLF